MIDLHLHTTYSDGASQTEEIIAVAIEQGLKAIAITDHDNTESFQLAKKAAEGSPLEVIPGIEINTVWETEIRRKEVHVLGFFIDPADPDLRALIERHRKARVVQIQEMAKVLRQNGKLDIDFEDISKRSCEHGTLGRPHVAQALLEKGGVNTISEAFQKYLNPDCKTYVKRQTVSPHEAVETIYESGGIPVIAHPGDMPDVEKLVLELMDHGLGGLEAYHKSHSPGTIEFYCTLAEKHNLIVTGGTDFHGTADGYAQALGRLRIPDYVYTELLNERNRRSQASFKVS